MTGAGWLVCTDESIGQLRGSASQATVEDPFAFDRANYALTRRSRVAPQELTGARRIDRPSGAARTDCDSSILKHLSQNGVRRTTREESGAQTSVSSSKRVRLIFGDRRSVQAAPMTNGRRHNLLRSALINATTGCGLAGEEGFEPSIS